MCPLPSCLGFCFDFASNLLEVGETLAGEVEKFAVLWPLLEVDELQDEGSARDDSDAPREEIAPDNSLEDAGFARALAADHADRGEEILEAGNILELGIWE